MLVHFWLVLPLLPPKFLSQDPEIQNKERVNLENKAIIENVSHYVEGLFDVLLSNNIQ